MRNVNKTPISREELLAQAGWSRCENPAPGVFPTSFPGQSCWTHDKDPEDRYRVFVVDSGYALEISHGAACPPSLLRFVCRDQEADFQPAFNRLQSFIRTGHFEAEG